MLLSILLALIASSALIVYTRIVFVISIYSQVLEMILSLSCLYAIPIFLLHQVSADMPKGLLADYDFFVLTNRDMSSTLVLSFNPAETQMNNSIIMRDVSKAGPPGAFVSDRDIWYLKNDEGGTEIVNRFTNAPISMYGDESRLIKGYAEIVEFIGQTDGTYKIILFDKFLGLDLATQSNARLYPVVPPGQGGYGFWSMLPLPTSLVTTTVQTTLTKFLGVSSRFVGGARTIMSTMTATITSTELAGRGLHIQKRGLNLPTVTQYTTVTATTTAFITPSAQVVSNAATAITMLMHTVIVRVNGTITLTVTPTGAPELKIIPIKRKGSVSTYGPAQATVGVKTASGKSDGDRRRCGSPGIVVCVLVFCCSWGGIGGAW